MIAGAAADAHRRDEYLQAARLAVDPDRVQVELDLTPGIAVAAGVIAGIDRDANGSLDPGEIRAYSKRVLGDIRLEMDGTPLTLELIDSGFPTVKAMRRGEGVIRIKLAAAISRMDAGVHRLHYRITHRPDISVYLANALVPASNRLLITRQQRDLHQRDLLVEFTLR